MTDCTRIVPGLYKLVGRLAVPVDTIEEWSRNLNNDRHVAVEQIAGYTISTVFLGIDHSLGSGDDPLLFETMIFRPDGESEDCNRCASWEEAVDMHEAAVAHVIRRLIGQ